MTEWLKVVVLKTAVPSRVPRVRIPPSPPRITIALSCRLRYTFNMSPDEENNEVNYTQQPAVQPPAGDPADASNSEPKPTSSPDVQSNALVAESAPVTADNASSAAAHDDAVMRWQASEFIDHQKNPMWFGLLTLATVIACSVVYWLTKGDILATVVIGVAAIAFGVFASKKPRTLTYTLLPTSMKIGDKNYSYDDFKTFSVASDGALNNIILQPVKRFLPPLTVYFAGDDAERIFDILAAHIPHEEKTADPIDRLMKRIRF